ncbi:hypothetical protein P691DRAFT_757411 [Macrolepiota fuliginosa MF-IS2]|uniref:C2H2-type domain-containing protein n=1 Tax=Macrolepiota fuliginosa MF-IS2 TaxID=1400762 RepID=A0A9P5XHX1_9AGAR|nr:hypothetical protein P691DRAFT_757411 [Macrolepiota fuliginosa MF-IS2]
MAQPAPSNQPLYTCLSCSIAFLSPEEQRDHYKSDHHRYNMKRRVAGLPPVSFTVFNQKVLDRKEETAIMTSPRGSVCEVCNKVYTTENSYRSHLQSKKHKENEVRAASKSKTPPPPPLLESESEQPEVTPPKDAQETVLGDIEKKLASLAVDDETTEEEINRTIDEKIAAARARLSPSHCLFCPHQSAGLEDNLTHMSTAHSFFIPDAEYLVDITGLITYLGEKIAVGNVCIYCNGKGREFRTLDAVRKHMVDKSHCKIAYDTGDERLEVSDYYDFTTSYPDLKPKKNRVVADGNEEWEDVEDEEADSDEVDEVIDEEADDDDEEDEDDEDEDEEILDDQITYGDSHLELVLPSGARIGHRSMRRYYVQSFPGAPRGGKEEDPNSGAALVRRLLADKNSALVPRRGGFGAFGAGTDVIKARNRGEAREAGRHVREFRDQRRREEFKTKVGFKHNSQKHYRDPLLQ